MTYDPEGRAVNFSGLVASGYTGDGLRGVKYAGGYTYFLYDGEQPVCELNSSGAVTATDTFGPAGLLARHTAAGSALYTWDLSGSLAQRESTQGTGMDSAVTDAFGLVATSDNTPDPFSGFGGQWGGYTDAASAGQSGLTLFTHRYYDPATGRFLTRDPIGYEGGVNLYAYTQNDPVNRSDPRGLQTIQGGLGGTVVAGGGPGFDATGGGDANGNFGGSGDIYLTTGPIIGGSFGSEGSFNSQNFGPIVPVPPGNFDPDPLPIGGGFGPIIGFGGFGGWGTTGGGGSITWQGYDGGPINPNPTITASGPGITYGGGAGLVEGFGWSAWVGVGHLCQDIVKSIYATYGNGDGNGLT